MFKYIGIGPESVAILFVKCHCVFVITWDFEAIFVFGAEVIGSEFGLKDKTFNLFLSSFVVFEAFPTWFVQETLFNHILYKFNRNIFCKEIKWFKSDFSSFP